MCSNHVTPLDFRPGWLKWQVDQALDLSQTDSTHLDLGSGRRPANPFGARTVYASDVQDLNIDPTTNYRFLKIRDFSSIDLPNESLDSISAFDVLEHIPRIWQGPNGQTRFPFIDMMNEISRLLKPGGIFIGITPAFPKPQAFQDPTHVNIISEETIKYFDENEWAKVLGYGFDGSFTKVHQSWLRGSGPYLGRYNEINGNFEIPKDKQLKHLAKIANRVTRLSKGKNSFSLLWVLRKNCN
jgi:SAM-dependent methyltransferase